MSSISSKPSGGGLRFLELRIGGMLGDCVCEDATKGWRQVVNGLGCAALKVKGDERDGE